MMKKTTAGEYLFYLIRDDVLDQTGKRNVSWSNIGTLLNDPTGISEYTQYIKGATAVHVTRRLLRFWSSERRFSSNESLHVSKVTAFVRREVFPGLSDSIVTKVSRSVVKAVNSSWRAITPQVRKNVIGENKSLSCYLCARPLDQKAKAESDSFLTLEHLWPTSIGGDSIEDNLIPACSTCQKITKDTAAWEWLNVQNHVFSTTPSEDELTALPRNVKYAKHYFEATKLADRDHLSLKQAFMKLGPIKSPLTYANTGLPLTFFDINTF